MRGRWFAGWIVVGVLGTLTVVGAASIGFLVLPLFLVALFLVSRRTRYALDGLGFIVGIGVICLVVAYINRDGPFDPHPWLVAGVALMSAGLGGYWALRLASRARSCRRSTS